MTTTASLPDAPLLLVDFTQQIHRFFNCLDEYRYDDMVAMFTPDAVWLRQGQRIQGRAAIRAVLAQRAANQRIRHVMTNTFLAAREGDRFRVLSYMTAYRCELPPAHGVPVISGPFRLNLVTTWFTSVGGQCLIDEQHMVPEFAIEPTASSKEPA